MKIETKYDKWIKFIKEPNEKVLFSITHEDKMSLVFPLSKRELIALKDEIELTLERLYQDEHCK